MSNRLMKKLDPGNSLSQPKEKKKTFERGEHPVCETSLKETFKHQSWLRNTFSNRD